MTRSEKAHDAMVVHNANCAQNTIAAFDDVGIDKETALKITLGFGGGLGGSGSVCGAVIAAYMVLGLKLPFDPTAPKKHREKVNAQIAEFNTEFLARHGSLICRELKASQPGQDNLCPNLVKSAVEIVEGLS
jgi:C_GCAxxG_C_C family probable redox protein